MKLLIVEASDELNLKRIIRREEIVADRGFRSHVNHERLCQTRLLLSYSGIG